MNTVIRFALTVAAVVVGYMLATGLAYGLKAAGVQIAVGGQ